MDFEIPEALAVRARRRRGAQGAAWVRRLKPGLTSFAVEHELEPVRRLQLGQELAVGYVVRLADARVAVLRAVEDRGALGRQAEALTLWGDRPAVDLLAVDVDRGLLLLEALDPDRDLRTVPRDEALAIACEVAAQLWIPTPADHTTLTPTLPGGEFAATGAIPPVLADHGHAAELRRRSTAEARRVLHGDLHRSNVLASGNDHWKAIDPYPSIAPPAVDLAVLASDLIADDVGSARAVDRLLDVVNRMAVITRRHGIVPSSVLDWMLLHRLDQIAAAGLEARSPDWDLRFAELIVAGVHRVGPGVA